MLHAKALFLVNDDQAQVLEHYAVREDAVGTDHHVHRAGCDFFGNLAGFLRLLEAGEHTNLHGESREALAERLVVLLGEQGRGYEHGNLFAVLHRLECGTYGDLGFAEAHVAGDEAVHGDFFLHVLLYLVDGGELVGSLVVGEGLFQLTLPGGVCGEGVTARCLACRIEFHQVGGDFLNCLTGAGLGLRPVAAAHLGQTRVLATHVVGDEVQLIRGHKKSVGSATALGGGILDDQVFLHGLHTVDRGGARHRARSHLDEATDAVAFVYHVVAGVQRERINRVAAAARGESLSGGASGCVGSAASKQFGFGEDGELRLLKEEACGGGCLADLHDAVFEVPGGVGFEAGSAGCGYGGCPFAGVEKVDEAVGGAAAVGEGEDGPLLLNKVANLAEHAFDGAVECGCGGGVDGVGVDAIFDGVGNALVFECACGGVFEQVCVGDEFGDFPPAELGFERLCCGLVDGAESAVAHAELSEVDGCYCVGFCGGVPCGGEEFFVGGDEVFGAGAHTLGFDVDNHGSSWQQLGEGVHGFDE